MKRLWRIVIALSLCVSDLSATAQHLRQPNVPATASNPDFPLRVHISGVRWGGRVGYYRGFGSANLTSPVTRGFDFSFLCGSAFLNNEAPDATYQARWKRPDQQIEILTAPVASNHEEGCTLEVAMKPQPFTPADAAGLTDQGLILVTPFWEAPEVPVAGPDPDFPLQLHVITGSRLYDQFGAHGYGYANLLGSPPQGVDYSYNCNMGFRANTREQDFYLARWVRPNEELEVLMQRAGGDKPERCKVKVNLQTKAYDRRLRPSTGGPGTAAPVPTH